MLSSDTTDRTARRDALAGRLFDATLGLMDLGAVYMGDRLGLYRALQDLGPATPAELALATGTHERYAREWLEQQAVSGLLEVDDAARPPEARRYSLPPGHADVLVDPESLSAMAPLAQFGIGVIRAMPALLEAFRTGGGVSWAAFGADVREAQAAQNRPAFLRLLGEEWLPAVPDLHHRLQADPPARVADVACGAGWSAIGIARAYPKVRVDGLDLDGPSIDLARANVAKAGLADRITLATRDAADPALAGRYDLVTIFESLHDMSRPVDVLRACRHMLAAGGSVLVVDERVADAFLAPGDQVERLMYGFSVLCCLPAGMADQPSAATGTVMRTETLRRYAAEAGLRTTEVLPVANDLFRFYRLRP
jgi:2-polyprenyl-3-methyl-5-hydroxy-6-metoxy-1,4-benzoquinol methylase